MRAQRKLQSPSLFGEHVLEVCAMADIVFLALHGRTGEDGRVQATLDLLGIPYTGSGYLGSAIAMDKDLTKRVVAPLGVKTPAWMLVESDGMDIDAVCAQAKLPCVVKPDDSGSSIGVSIANDEAGAARRARSGRPRGQPHPHRAVHPRPRGADRHPRRQGPAQHRDHPGRGLL
ncbi:MAG: hypothetical protein V8S57_02495 [Oscillospiraceae bacterium]